MPESRRQKLKDLGFIWDIFEYDWEESLIYLRAYKEKFGDLSVPQNYTTSDGFALGTRVGNWRAKKDELRPNHIEDLDQLGFSWLNSNDVAWTNLIQRLEGYRTEFGDCLVPCFSMGHMSIATIGPLGFSASGRLIKANWRTWFSRLVSE